MNIQTIDILSCIVVNHKVDYTHLILLRQVLYQNHISGNNAALFIIVEEKVYLRWMILAEEKLEPSLRSIFFAAEKLVGQVQSQAKQWLPKVAC